MALSLFLDKPKLIFVFSLKIASVCYFKAMTFALGVGVTTGDFLFSLSFVLEFFQR
jgi:hypothetical protein